MPPGAEESDLSRIVDKLIAKPIDGDLAAMVSLMLKASDSGLIAPAELALARRDLSEAQYDAAVIDA